MRFMMMERWPALGNCAEAPLPKRGAADDGDDQCESDAVSVTVSDGRVIRTKRGRGGEHQ